MSASGPGLTVRVAQVNSSVPYGRHYGSTPRPYNGWSCARGPGRIRSGTDGGLSQEDITSRTAPLIPTYLTLYIDICIFLASLSDSFIWVSIWSHVRSVQLLVTRRLFQTSTRDKETRMFYAASIITFGPFFVFTVEYYFILVLYKLNRLRNPRIQKVLYSCTISLVGYTRFIILDQMVHI